MYLTAELSERPLSGICVLLSLGMTAAAILLPSLFERRRGVHGNSDVILAGALRTPWVGRMLQVSPLMTGTVVWIVGSTVISVIVPWKSKSHYFATADGLITTVNFCLLLAVATGVYFRLKIRTDEFLNDQVLGELGLHRVPSPRHRRLAPLRQFAGAAYQLGVVGIALSAQYSAIVSELRFAPPEYAWIDRVGEANHFNIFGALHYAMRGIAAYFGLNLATVVGRLAVELCLSIELGEPRRLFTPGYRVADRVKSLATTLVLGAVLGSAMSALQGAVLFLVVQTSRVDAAHVFLQSTWIFWFLLLATITVLVIGILQRLQHLLRQAKNVLEARAFQGLTPHGADASAAAVKDYWEAHGALRRAIGDIPVTPLAWSGTASVFAAVLLQLVGVVGAILQLVGRAK